MSLLRPDASLSRIAPQLLSARWALIRERLRAEQLSGLVCFGRGELHSYGAVEYVTGDCPWGVEVYSILGLSGAPLLLAVGPGAAKATSTNAVHVAPPRLGETLRSWTQRLRIAGRVGTAGENPKALRDFLLDIELHDFTAELAAIRSIKLPAEIEQLQAVSDLADEALAYFIEQIRTDIRSAPSRVEKMIAKQGARHSIVRLGPGPRFDQQPDASEFAEKSLLCAYVEVLGANGYWVELMRPVALASLDAAEKRHLAACSKVSDVTKALLRPGETGGRVYEAAANAAHAAGMRLDGGCGHGLGIDDQDLPRLAPGDRTALSWNMAVALHPRLVDDDRGRGLVVGDTYVLYDTEPKRLSRFSSELITVHL
jgi:Xaa-Pro aminopeptidase